MSLFFNSGVSLSFRHVFTSQRRPLPAFLVAPFREAPYPAFTTASMMAWEEAVPSTPMELVSRLTEQEVTPGTF